MSSMSRKPSTISSPAYSPVYHRDPDVLGLELANQHQRPCFRNVADFLASLRAGEILADAVILATPNNTHAPLATKLVVAGLAVLVEKPFTATGAEGRELLKARSEAPSGKAVVMVGHHRRHNPYTIAVKQAIDEGRLGRIVAINGGTFPYFQKSTANLLRDILTDQRTVWAMRKPPEYFANHWRRQLGSGGVVLNNAIHEIDILQYLLGNIVEVYAVEGVKERPHPVDETVLATLKFASGALTSGFIRQHRDLATLLGIRDRRESSHPGRQRDLPHDPWHERISRDSFIVCFVLLAPKLASRLRLLNTCLISRTRFHQDDRPHQEQNWSFPLTRDNTLKSQIDNDDTPPLARQLKHFIAAVRGEVEPNCSGEDGLRAVMVVEAILKSLEKHEPVTVERV
ncbi:hypothetical protein AYO22_07678 [Fonsecaea multimorphosa]|nr:hypothetical protein AYO22_07678 [Fonsecaea multimorphosa]